MSDEVVLAERRDGVVSLGEDDVLRLRGAHHIIAFTPVTARPMISFWIWEVPS